MDKKLSIIIPVYNTEKFLGKCLDSVLNQTYSNIEVVVVNDGSTDGSADIIEQYKKNDNRIISVSLVNNGGLFNARLKGFEKCTGEYIACLDSDDFVRKDYYRTLISEANKQNADIICSKFIDYVPKTKLKAVWISNHLMQDISLEDEQILEAFNNTKFVLATWWLMWNKVYKKSLWDKCYKYFCKVSQKVTYLEDFLYGNILLSNAKKFVFSECNSYYYVRHENACTSNTNDIETILKYSEDKKYVLDFVSNYYVGIKRYNLIKDSLKYFAAYQKDSDIKKINGTSAGKEAKEEAIQKVEFLYGDLTDQQTTPDFFVRTGNVDERYEEVKELIISPTIKVVSFDIFDTLILRPFYTPVDLFELLNSEYEKIINKKSIIPFSKMRIEAEKQMREDLKYFGAQLEEVTLKQIYQKIADLYQIDFETCKKIEQAEIELEYKYAQPRKSVIQLFELAKYLNKTVICVSDIYMNYDAINRILEKYSLKYDKLFISSEIGLTKATGNLYKTVISEMGVLPEEIAHIGDNWKSDIVIAREKGLKAFFIPKAIECFENKIPPQKRAEIMSSVNKEMSGNWLRHRHTMENLGIRCMCAIIANKYFDNPFSTFAELSDFNADAQYMGYFALGMNNFGVAKWILDDVSDKKVSTVHFVARDGYAVKQTFDILRNYYVNAPKSNYIYLSRKSMLPLLVKEKSDLMMLDNYFNIKNFTPRELLEMLNLIFLPLTPELEQKYKESGVLLDQKLQNHKEFQYVVRSIINISYSEQRICDYRSKMKKYFASMIKPNDVMFDIGYSGRGQAVLSELLGYPINAYYIHTLKDAAQNFSQKYLFNVKTFMGYVPTITGRQREMLQSDTAPSCVGYEIQDEKVLPVFEKQKMSPWGIYIMNTIHRGSKEFAEDFCKIFGDELDKMYFSNFDASYAHEYLMHKIKEKDLILFSQIGFEDDIMEGFKNRSLSDIWKKDQEYFGFNQVPIAAPKNNKIFKPSGLNSASSKTVTTSTPIKKEEYFLPQSLIKASKFKKALYYLLFDYKTFKRKIKNYLKKTKHLQNKIKTITKPTQENRFSVPSANVKKIEIKEKHKKTFYYVLSNYQLLCCVLHKLLYNNDNESILMLSSYRSKLLPALEKSGFFGNKIYLWDDKQPVGLFERTKKDACNFSEKDWKEFEKAYFEYIESQLPFDIRGFKEYFLSADCESLGIYFMKNKIPYSFFEDSAGIFTRPEIVEKNNKTLFIDSKRRLIERYPAYGKNPKINAIFLNKSAQVQGKLLPKNAVDLNVMQLMKKIKKEDLQKIFEIFEVPKITVPEGRKKALLLTQQMAAFKKMTKEEQNLMYSYMVDYFAEGYQLIVKPHPDDTYSDYNQIFPGCNIISSKILSEFMPFITDTNYDIGITATSASILNLKSCIRNIVRLNPLFEETWRFFDSYYAVAYWITGLNLQNFEFLTYGANFEQMNAILENTDIKNKKIKFKNWEDRSIEGFKFILIDSRYFNQEITYADFGKQDIIVVLSEPSDDFIKKSNYLININRTATNESPRRNIAEEKVYIYYPKTNILKMPPKEKILNFVGIKLQIKLKKGERK